MYNTSSLSVIALFLILSMGGCNRCDRDRALYQLAIDYLTAQNWDTAGDILYPACRDMLLQNHPNAKSNFQDFGDQEAWDGWQNANLHIFVDDSKEIAAYAKKLVVKYSLNEQPIYFEIVVQFPDVTRSTYHWAVLSDCKYRILWDEELAMLDPNRLRDDAFRREISK